MSASRLALTCLLGTTLLCFMGCSPAHKELLGDQLPDLRLQTLDGKQERLSNFRGKVTLINFWATWCEPCRREMPDLQKLSDTTNSDEIVVLGVSVDTDVNLVREFNLKYGITIARFIDSERQIAEGILHLDGYPQTLVVTPAGKVAMHQRGIRNWAEPRILEKLREIYRTSKVETPVKQTRR